MDHRKISAIAVYKTEIMILFWFCFKTTEENKVFRKVISTFNAFRECSPLSKGQYSIFLESFKIIEIAHFANFLEIFVTSSVIVESY